jgi:hypothetical protein
MHGTDPAEAEKFLNLLDPDARGFTFQTFDDDVGRRDPSLVRVFNGTLRDHLDALADLNARGAGVYVTINETNLEGRTTDKIVRVRALFADFDKASDAAPKTEPRRHVVVSSSPGKWHVYWRANGVALSAFSAIQAAIAQKYGSDPAVKDLPRVMRLPGFLHRKGEPFTVRVVEVNDDAPVVGAADFVTDYAYSYEDRYAGVGTHQFEEPSPWAVLNTLALRNLEKWVPELFGAVARYQSGTKSWRISSKALGRDLEEDISIHPGGIKDWGVHDLGDSRQGRRSPIDVVMEFRRIDKVAAFRWLDVRVRGDESYGHDHHLQDQDHIPHATDNQTGTSDSNSRVSGALSVEQWLARDLPRPDFILGEWLTTTSPSIMYAPTGIGKTMLALAMAMAMALGRPFLHWPVRRPSRVLFIDGEMARRVMKDRIAAETSRLGGAIPETMFLLSREDVEDFKPLNTPEGRSYHQQRD